MKPLIEVMKEIKSQNLSHYNIWVGEEIAVLNIYQKKIQELGYNIITLESVSQAYQAICKKSLNNNRNCYVIIDDTQYAKEDNVWERVIERFNKSKHILLLKYTNLDKRSKLYKQGDPFITMFDKLSEEVLFRYVKKEIPELSDSNVLELIKICDGSYNRILLESDKINTYANAKEIHPNYAFDQLDKQGIFNKPIGDIIFQFIDAVSGGYVEESQSLLQKIKEKGENELAVLSLLYTSFKNMLMVQSCGGNGKVTEITGLTGWQVKKSKDNIGGYTIQELLNSIKCIREVEKGIKVGKVPVECCLEYTLVKVMS